MYITFVCYKTALTDYVVFELRSVEIIRLHDFFLISRGYFDNILRWWWKLRYRPKNLVGELPHDEKLICRRLVSTLYASVILTIWTFRFIVTHINSKCWLKRCATEVRSLTTVGITHVRTLKSSKKRSKSECWAYFIVRNDYGFEFLCPNKEYGKKRNPVSIWSYWNEILANVRHLGAVHNLLSQ